MMPLHLNLISPEKKNNFLKMARFLFIKEMMEFTIFTVSLLAMMYLFAWWVVADAMSDAVASALLVNREVPTVNKDVQRINLEAKNIVTSGTDFYPLTPKILEFIAMLPPDIRLNGLEIDRLDSSIVLSGTAATRDALLNFQKTINSVPWIKGITSPTSQLLQKENITFDVEGNLQGIPRVKAK